ncbi:MULTISPECIES: hypothetical protein [Burkholderia]|nr:MULTISPECIES: hypothetical protein [Burkholderia]
MSDESNAPPHLSFTGNSFAARVTKASSTIRVMPRRKRLLD